MSINLLSNDVASPTGTGPARGQAKTTAKAATPTNGNSPANGATTVNQPMSGAKNDNRPTSTTGTNQPANQRPQSTAASGKAPKATVQSGAGQAPQPTSFVTMVQKAVQALQTNATAANGPLEAAPSAADLAQMQETLALLAQFANVLPQLIQPQTADALALQELVAGSGDLASLTELDMAGLQTLLQGGEANPAQPADGQFLPSVTLDTEQQAQMRSLIEQMRHVADSLAMVADPIVMPNAVAALTSQPTTSPIEVAADQPATAQATESIIQTPADLQPVTAAPQQPISQPIPQAAPAADSPAGRSETTASATAGHQAAQAPKGTELDLLLKPLRGELHVEGDFALKGPRLDGATQAAARPNPQLLQALDEQGKSVALTLNGPKAVPMAETVGLQTADAPPEIKAETGKGPVIPAAADDGEGATATLLRTAVSAVDADQAVGDFPAQNAEQALKLGGGRAEGIDGTPLASASGPPPGGPLEQAGGPPRAQQAVMQQVIDRVKELLPGPASIRMVLQPESLGQLTVRLVSHQGQVSVRVLTENADVQRMLDGNLSHLKAALADSGVKLEGVQVVHVPTQGQQQQHGEQGQRQPQPGDQQQARREATDEEQAELDRLIELLQQAEA